MCLVIYFFDHCREIIQTNRGLLKMSTVKYYGLKFWATLYSALPCLCILMYGSRRLWAAIVYTDCFQHISHTTFCSCPSFDVVFSFLFFY